MLNKSLGVCPEFKNLRTLIGGINSDFNGSASEIPHAVRARLQRAIKSPDLFLNSAELLLKQALQAPSERFLFADPQGRYTLQLFCWPPRFGNDPHLHNTWAVTAVFSNSILVYRGRTSEVECLTSQPLLAHPGEVGVLIPPQFHFLRNPTDNTTITFHVFSADGRLADKHEPANAVSPARVSNAGILALAKEPRDPRGSFRPRRSYHETRSFKTDREDRC